MIAVLPILVLSLTAAAQSDVEIRKYTNGQDANSAPGPSIDVGAPVTWTYVVSNTGGRELTNISVTDDQGVIVTCPATVLDAGVSFTCTASGLATAGQYANIGSVTATRSNGTVVTASDPSHYFGVMPVVSSTKNDTLLVDADADGQAEPGDTLRYTVVITNSGTGDASAVTFTDTPDPNTALVTGSVTTSAGTVTSGNTAGDPSASVSIGTVAPTATVTITFDVVIANPLAPGVTTITNQGTIAGGNFPPQPTDDPSQGGAADPTVTPVVAAPAVTATKSDALVVDADGDGLAEPGDTLLYTVVLANNGNTAATAVTFADTPGANTTLVSGSVTTTAGTVTTGNTAGNTTVQVAAGTLAVSGSATIIFRVTINATPPPGTTSVANQGTVSGTNFSTTPTDDPGTAAASDPTVTPITVTPPAAVPPAAVPTLETWGAATLLMTAAAMALWRLSAR